MTTNRFNFYPTDITNLSIPSSEDESLMDDFDELSLTSTDETQNTNEPYDVKRDDECAPFFWLFQPKQLALTNNQLSQSAELRINTIIETNPEQPNGTNSSRAYCVLI